MTHGVGVSPRTLSRLRSVFDEYVSHRDVVPAVRATVETLSE